MSSKRKNKPKVKGRKGTAAAKRKNDALAAYLATQQYRADLGKEYSAAARESFAKALLGVLWSEHFVLGFGRKRTMRMFIKHQEWFTKYMIDPLEDTTEGSFEGISFEDIRDQLYEETGILIDPYTAKYQMDDEAMALWKKMKAEGC